MKQQKREPIMRSLFGVVGGDFLFCAVLVAMTWLPYLMRGGQKTVAMLLYSVATDAVYREPCQPLHY